MTGPPFLTARIDVNGGREVHADQACVPWWSFTKTALATAALQLVARGYCSLDDRIDSRAYTLRQLLQHRAGVPDYGGLASYHEAVRRGDKPWALDDLLDRVRAVSISIPDMAGAIPTSGICFFVSSSRRRSVEVSAAPCDTWFSTLLALTR
jgi:CubicO group peptidase (beta-lactamase class C family)